METDLLTGKGFRSISITDWSLSADEHCGMQLRDLVKVGKCTACCDLNILHLGYSSLFEIVWGVQGHNKFGKVCLHNVDISKIEAKLWTQCFLGIKQDRLARELAITEEPAQHYSTNAPESKN